MRPNAKTSSDVIQAAALPSVEGMELDYRTALHRQSRTWTLGSILQAVVAALLLTLILRTVGVYLTGLSFLVGTLLAAGVSVLWCRAPSVLLLGAVVAGLACLTRSPIQLICLGALMICFAALSHLSQRLAGRFHPYGLFGASILLWILSVSCNTGLFAVFLLIGLAGTLLLCDLLTYHHAAWMNANPNLGRRMRKRWLFVWQRPSTWDQWRKLCESVPGKRSCRNPILDSELQARARYLLGYLIVALLYLLALLLYVVNPDPIMRGPAAVAVLVVMLIAYGTLNILVNDSLASVVLAARVLHDAVTSWFAYNVSALTAPGVFQSPCGPASKRLRLFQGNLALLTIVLLPACWYFSISARMVGMPQWLAAAAKTDTLAADWAKAGVQNTQLSQSALHATNADFHFSPERSLTVHARALLSPQPRGLLITLLSLGACSIVPAGVLVSTLWAVSSRLFLHHYRTLEGPDGTNGLYQDRHQSTWQAYVSRLQASRFATVDSLGAGVRERDHVLLGFGEEGDYPVLVSTAILSEHAHITGDSGSGKSSLGITPLTEQLIARGDCSVVILDLKNDMSVFEAARLATERVNKNRKDGATIPFRWFTNASGRSTFLFNPISQRDMQGLTPHQRAEVLLNSLGLDYGEGFGPSYFSSAHRHVLKRILTKNPHFGSFRQIDEFIRDGRFALSARDIGIDRKAREEASHLYTVIESLASIDSLNVVDTMDMPNQAADLCIEMGDVVRRPHVLYFGLASALEQKSVKEIAKLALHTLLVAAVGRGYSKHQTFLFIDEFQQVVSHDLEIVLRQARSQGISAILANQTLSDLKTGPIDITPTVQANTRLRQVFSASDLLHQNVLIEASGEAIYVLHGSAHSEGRTSNGTTSSVTESSQEHIGPRLRRNDVIEITDHPLRSILHVTRGHGFTQFGGMMIPMRSAYHIAPETYIARRGAKWPAIEDHPGTVICPLELDSWPDRPRKTPTPTPPSVAADDPAFAELERRLDEMKGTQSDEKHDHEIKH